MILYEDIMLYEFISISKYIIMSEIWVYYGIP